MKTFQQFQEGLLKKALITTALATPFLAKKFLKPKTDKMLDTQRKTNKIGGDKRSGNTDFQKGVDALKDAKKSGGLMNKSTKDALKMLDNY
tara:strand:- start:45 stop:317 length:273 start_codon:yes stop_codon:yes gene_type:complete